MDSDQGGRVGRLQPDGRPWKQRLRVFLDKANAVGKIFTYIVLFAFAVRFIVGFGVAVVHYFQGSCSIFDCMSQVPFISDWTVLPIIIIIVVYIGRFILRYGRQRTVTL